MAVTGVSEGHGCLQAWGEGNWRRFSGPALRPGTLDKRKALGLRPWFPRIHSSWQQGGEPGSGRQETEAISGTGRPTKESQRSQEGSVCPWREIVAPSRVDAFCSLEARRGCRGFSKRRVRAEAAQTPPSEPEN